MKPAVRKAESLVIGTEIPTAYCTLQTLAGDRRR